MPTPRTSWAFNWQNSYNTETVTLYRETETYNNDGSDDYTMAKIDDIIVSMQPISETDLINLPEGDRELVAFKIYTSYADLQAEDIVRRSSIDYKIKKPPMEWRIAGELHHYKAFIYNIEND